MGAEAMAYKANQKAPDDQVLDKLLVEGGWLKRASFGWLPAAYLRTVPSYYKGVDPVIDHDHGNPPGLLKHSEAKPVHRVVRAELRDAELPAGQLRLRLDGHMARGRHRVRQLGYLIPWYRRHGGRGQIRACAAFVAVVRSRQRISGGYMGASDARAAPAALCGLFIVGFSLHVTRRA